MSVWVCVLEYIIIWCSQMNPCTLSFPLTQPSIALLSKQHMTESVWLAEGMNFSALLYNTNTGLDVVGLW